MGLSSVPVKAEQINSSILRHWQTNEGVQFINLEKWDLHWKSFPKSNFNLFASSEIWMRWINWNKERYKIRWMNNLKERSWFRVFIKVEQVMYNFCLNTYENKPTEKVRPWMTWRWVDAMTNELKRPSRINTRDIHPREAQRRNRRALHTITNNQYYIIPSPVLVMKISPRKPPSIQLVGVKLLSCDAAFRMEYTRRVKNANSDFLLRNSSTSELLNIHSIWMATTSVSLKNFDAVASVKTLGSLPWMSTWSK